MGDHAVDIAGGGVGLEGVGDLGVDGVVDGPDCGRGVETLFASGILEFGPVAAFGHPEGGVDGFADGFGFIEIGGGIFAYYLSHAGGHEVGEAVVGRGVGDGAAAVVEGITGPDAAVGVIEVVAVRVEVEFFPGEMAFDHREEAAHGCGVACVAEVAHEGINVDEVHVVVRHFAFLSRSAAYVAVAVHGCSPAFFSPREVEGAVLAGMLECGGDVGNLIVGIGGEMGEGAVVAAYGVAYVGTAPSEVGRAPSNRAVEPCLSAPDAVSGH